VGRLLGEHPSHGSVDDGLVQLAGSHEPGEPRERIGLGQFDVDAGGQRESTRRGR